METKQWLVENVNSLLIGPRYIEETKRNNNIILVFFIDYFIHNYIVFEAKFLVYTKGCHHADIFSSLFPIFFRRNEKK